MLNPTLAAKPLLEYLFVKKGKKTLWPGFDREGDADVIDYLMFLYYHTKDMRFNATNAHFDNQAKSAFSQSFLEYLMYNVRPHWSQAERFLSEAITARGYDDSKAYNASQNLIEAVKKLAYNMQWKKFVKYLHDHLRFPNMTTIVLDYPDVKDAAGKKKLDEYREKMGLPTSDMKTGVLKMIRGLWNKISEMSDGVLQLNLKLITPQYRSAVKERKYTGESDYAI